MNSKCHQISHNDCHESREKRHLSKGILFCSIISVFRSDGKNFIETDRPDSTLNVDRDVGTESQDDADAVDNDGAGVEDATLIVRPNQLTTRQISHSEQRTIKLRRNLGE